MFAPSRDENLDPHLAHGSLNQYESPTPNGISIGSAISFTHVHRSPVFPTHRHTEDTDHATCDIYRYGPAPCHACYAAL